MEPAEATKPEYGASVNVAEMGLMGLALVLGQSKASTAGPSRCENSIIE